MLVLDQVCWSVRWDKIKLKVCASVKRIRGKLNVSRERFRVRKDGVYVGAGMAKP